MTTEPKYTDTQIETMAAHLISSTPNWYRESFGDWKDAVHTCDRAPKDAADMLRSLLAERIEADESAMPVATTCAKEVDDNSVSFCCLDWIALAALPTGTELFTHPPAQADYPECSGDPSNCPENEDFGCCMANLPAQLVQGEEVDCPECGTRCTERVIRMSDDVIREYTPVARPAQEQPGWKLLPIEPTMEMVREGLAHSHCPPMNADRLAQIYMA
ncbi:MAG TPA: hypothetical protein VGV14_00720, partial [Rhodanobacter sp.]|nr:hypothetical protein [Rhodanobacter sp.]